MTRVHKQGKTIHSLVGEQSSFETTWLCPQLSRDRPARCHGGMQTGLVAIPDVSGVIDYCKKLQLRKMDGPLVGGVSQQVPAPFESTQLVSTNAGFQDEPVTLVLTHHRN